MNPPSAATAAATTAAAVAALAPHHSRLYALPPPLSLHALPPPLSPPRPALTTQPPHPALTTLAFTPQGAQHSLRAEPSQCRVGVRCRRARDRPRALRRPRRGGVAIPWRVIFPADPRDPARGQDGGQATARRHHLLALTTLRGCCRGGAGRHRMSAAGANGRRGRVDVAYHAVPAPK